MALAAAPAAAPVPAVAGDDIDPALLAIKCCLQTTTFGAIASFGKPATNRRTPDVPGAASWEGDRPALQSSPFHGERDVGARSPHP